MVVPGAASITAAAGDPIPSPTRAAIEEPSVIVLMTNV
jgi:hypothetical protein